MPFDGLVLSAVRQELNDKLIGGRIDRIHQPTKDELILNIHHPGGRQRLLLSAHAFKARVHTTTESKENPPSPPLFCMVLRKHLEGGRICGFHQPGLDRVLRIEVEARDELGQTVKKLLICEIMGKHSNIILVNEASNTIIDGIKRYSHTVSRHREVLPKRIYLPPPEQGKQNPLVLTEETFRECLLSGSLEARVANIIQKFFDGLSPLICREIVYRSGLPDNLILDHCGDHELRMLWQALQSIIVPARDKKFKPTALFDRYGKPVDFAAFDILHLEGFSKETGEMCSVLDCYYSAVHKFDQINSQKQSLYQVIRKEISRVQKKLSLHRQSLQDANEAEQYRIYGELLTANLYRLSKGETEVYLENFYDPQGAKLSVPLDPQLTPVENSQQYFKKYLKAKNTITNAEEQLQKAQADLNYLESVATSVDQAITVSELVEIRQEMIEQSYISDIKNQIKLNKNKKEQEKPRPMSFNSTDGYIILVGKNNKQNDYLTTKIANDEDIWLHTKDIPGSHVIIRSGGNKVPENTLLEAASLAGYFSKARDSSKVPVDYTYKKYVHKPKGAKPGYVIYENQKTLYVDPGEDILEKLALND
ncbi:Rqc2 family fibronectin-binding protein [Desulfolucanica intricata]|uniref:Rqc2 family fibronectin-binding protein n=1 Tax=Desulfolucanica intricata TaxID=1285191 RepID=UPI00082C2A42|nr:NFACT RNA binding domain-containing protein [Desulfolucanica intricata]